MGFLLNVSGVDCHPERVFQLQYPSNLSSGLAKDLRARWAPVGREYALAAASCTHLPKVFGGYTHETSNSRY